MIVGKIVNGLERGFVKHRLNCELITDPLNLSLTKKDYVRSQYMQNFSIILTFLLLLLLFQKWNSIPTEVTLVIFYSFSYS